MSDETNIIAAKLPDLKSKIYFLLRLIIAGSLIVYLVYYISSKNIIFCSLTNPDIKGNNYLIIYVYYEHMLIILQEKNEISKIILI